LFCPLPVTIHTSQDEKYKVTFARADLYSLNARIALVKNRALTAEPVVTYPAVDHYCSLAAPNTAA